MEDARSRGRKSLHDWREAQPKNFFDNPHLEASLQRHWDRETWPIPDERASKVSP